MFPLCRVDTTTRVCSRDRSSVAARKPPYSCLCSHQRNENQLCRLARHRAGRAHVAEHSTALAPDKAESSSPSPELRFHGTPWCPLPANGKKDQELTQLLTTAPGSHIRAPVPAFSHPCPHPCCHPHSQGYSTRLPLEDYRLGQRYSLKNWSIKCYQNPHFKKTGIGIHPWNSNARKWSSVGPRI